MVFWLDVWDGYIVGLRNIYMGLEDWDYFSLVRVFYIGGFCCVLVWYDGGGDRMVGYLGFELLFLLFLFM